MGTNRRTPIVEASPPRHGAAAHAYPKRRSGLRERVIDGEMVVLDRHRQRVHQLNATARYIWERCDGRHSVLAIARELEEAFAVDTETVDGDVARAVRLLHATGLVRTRSASGPQAKRMC